jgi:hypothetical protein
MMHGRGVLTLGHVRVQAAESDVLRQVPCEESWVWIGDGSVLGSLLVEGATHLRAAFITAPERVQAVNFEPARSTIRRKCPFGGLRTLTSR